MFFYDKKIIYLTLVNGEEKTGGIGHLKIEVIDDECCFEITLSKISFLSERGFRIFGLSKEQRVDLGSILCKEGRGTYKERFLTRKIGKGKDKISYEELEGIVIDAGHQGYFEGRIQNSAMELGRRALHKDTDKVPDKMEEGPFTKVEEGSFDNVKEDSFTNVEEGSSDDVKEDSFVENKEKEQVFRPEKEEPETISGNTGSNEAMYEQPRNGLLEEEQLEEKKLEEKPETKSTIDTKPRQIDERLIELTAEHRAHQREHFFHGHEVKQEKDKWQRLLQQYKQVHPYGDERIYILIEPKDFVILPGEYQHLVNNSFLLHGFYNYRHIILGKEKKAVSAEDPTQIEIYYLGVPGMYYDREKMVAKMFGFEAFECEGDSVEMGTFGYYLFRVEL